jgi:hypothetical protein
MSRLNGWNSLLLYVMPGPSHPPWLHHPNKIWWDVKVTRLLVIQSSTASIAVWTRSKYRYVPKHPNLKHSSSLCSSLYMKGQVSHLHRLQSRAAAFLFSDRQENRWVSTEWQQASPPPPQFKSLLLSSLLQFWFIVVVVVLDYFNLTTFSKDPLVTIILIFSFKCKIRLICKWRFQKLSWH